MTRSSCPDLWLTPCIVFESSSPLCTNSGTLLYPDNTTLITKKELGITKNRNINGVVCSFNILACLAWFSDSLHIIYNYIIFSIAINLS